MTRATTYLSAHGVESPRETAEALLEYFLRVDRTGLYARAEGLDTRTAKLYGRALCQRCHGVPLQYLTGEQQFLDLVLGVAPGVFVPRPETEILVERALEALEGRT
ncbi:MAG TPA: peptide chain release factor N(5)-glutamine methyltransferase, partial [Actinomycetota bacterium]|nr:peptide chain release factor N(5)-glutamine methyltransferase [Actinomycetota bacterium]